MYLFILSLLGIVGVQQCLLKCTKFNFEEAANIIYLLFGFFISRSCEYCLLTTEWTFDHFGDTTTQLQHGILAVSTGYFLYDIPISIMLKEPWYMCFHHVASFLILGAAFITPTSGLETVICLWIGEFNSPFLFFRFWYEKDERWNKSTVMIINNSIFLILFCVLRFVMAPYVVYHIVYSEKSAIFIKVGSVLFYAVNFSLLFPILSEAKSEIRNNWKKEN